MKALAVILAVSMAQVPLPNGGPAASHGRSSDGGTYRLAVNSNEADAIGFAECIVMREPLKVGRLLRIPVEGDGATEQWRTISRGPCARTDRKAADIALLRGSIFVTLYRKSVSGTLPAGLPAHIGEADRSDDVSATEHARSMPIIRCAVSRDPANSRSFVLNREGSRGREMALAGLMTRLEDCLNGQEYVRLKGIAMAGLIAEALYLEAPRDQDGSSAFDPKRTGS